jgi:hypothetical protein
MTPNHVLTLVHGTWADTRGWVGPGSFLRRELEQRLVEPGTPERVPYVRFREFSWTGTNTHTARTQAGDELARFIRDGHAESPDARHFVIAHSHGGNIALYAMRDSAAREAVTGIVTLGTPFLSVRRRDPQRYADVMAWVVLCVAVLVPLIGLNALGLSRFLAGWLIGAAVLIVAMKPRLSRWLIETVTREQADILESLELPSIDRSKLMVLSARGDEAGRWLRTWDLVAKAPFAVGCILLLIVGVAGRFNLPTAVDYLGRSTVQRGLAEMRAFGFDGWTLTVGVLVLCVIWGVVLLGSSVVRWPGYWREPLLANVFVEISTRNVPDAVDGQSHVGYTFDVPPPQARNRQTHGPLRHTAISEEPAVVRAIANWIEVGVRP